MACCGELLPGPFGDARNRTNSSGDMADRLQPEEIGEHMRILVSVLLVAVGGTAFAQDTETVTPKPAEPSLNADVPPGGCMPFGVTAAGDLVFPIQCKEFIERSRGAAVDNKAAAEQKPAEVAKQPDVAGVESTSAIETPPVPLPKDKPAAQKSHRTPVESRRVDGDRRKRVTRRYFSGPPVWYEDQTGTVFLSR
jgi:hypothetical protein